MASGRIAYNRTNEIGGRLSQVCRNGIAFRRDAEELNRIFGRYNDDNAGLATDLGMAEGSVQAVRDLLARVVGETADVVLNGQAVAQGNPTHTRTFLDTLG